MLPVLFIDIRLFISFVVGQRKFHTLTLQSIIGSKIVDKIVERFVSLYRLRLFRQFIYMDRIRLLAESTSWVIDAKGSILVFLLPQEPNMQSNMTPAISFFIISVSLLTFQAYPPSCFPNCRPASTPTLGEHRYHPDYRANCRLCAASRGLRRKPSRTAAHAS